MTIEAAIFERSWNRIETGTSPLALAPMETWGVRGELLLATGLRENARIIPRPDWDAAWDDLLPRLLAARSDEGPADVTGIPAAELAALRGRFRRRTPGTARPRRTVATLAAATMALMMLASVGAAVASPGSLLYPVRRAMERGALIVSPADGAILGRIAQARLDDLLEALSGGHVSLAPALAADLVEAREALLSSGRSSVALDRAIRTVVPPALSGAPSDVAEAVRATLGALLPAAPLPASPRPAAAEAGLEAAPAGILPGSEGSAGAGAAAGSSASTSSRPGKASGDGTSGEGTGGSGGGGSGGGGSGGGGSGGGDDDADDGGTGAGSGGSDGGDDDDGDDGWFGGGGDGGGDDDDGGWFGGGGGGGGDDADDDDGWFGGGGGGDDDRFGGGGRGGGDDDDGGGRDD